MRVHKDHTEPREQPRLHGKLTSGPSDRCTARTRPLTSEVTDIELGRRSRRRKLVKQTRGAQPGRRRCGGMPDRGTKKVYDVGPGAREAVRPASSRLPARLQLLLLLPVLSILWPQPPPSPTIAPPLLPRPFRLLRLRSSILHSVLTPRTSD